MRNEYDLLRLQARVHELLAPDVLSTAELALLPPRVADIRGPRVRYRREVREHRIRTAALIVGVLLGGSLIVPPVSAAIARWLTAADAPATPEITRDAAAPEPVTLAQTEFSFVPETDRISVRFEEWQPGGTLTVGVATGATVVFRVERVDAAPAVMVSPAGVRVQNAASTARYRVLLPETVRSVDVEIAGTPHARLARPDGSEVVVPLEEGASPVPAASGHGGNPVHGTTASGPADCPFGFPLIG